MAGGCSRCAGDGSATTGQPLNRNVGDFGDSQQAICRRMRACTTFPIGHGSTGDAQLLRQCQLRQAFRQACFADAVSELVHVCAIPVDANRYMKPLWLRSPQHSRITCRQRWMLAHKTRSMAHERSYSYRQAMLASICTDALAWNFKSMGCLSGFRCAAQKPAACLTLMH